MEVVAEVAAEVVDPRQSLMQTKLTRSRLTSWTLPSRSLVRVAEVVVADPLEISIRTHTILCHSISLTHKHKSENKKFLSFQPLYSYGHVHRLNHSEVVINCSRYARKILSTFI